MPRHPKPAALRANWERQDIGLVSRPRVSDVPRPPTGLLKVNRDTWAEFWSSPLAQTAVPGTDLPALRRLWSLYDQRERSYRAAAKQRVVSGSMGQQRVHPLLTRADKLEAPILALEDRFGLSPRSRLTLGVILGDAARSLADINADFERDDEEEDAPDPRLLVVDRPTG